MLKFISVCCKDIFKPALCLLLVMNSALAQTDTQGGQPSPAKKKRIILKSPDGYMRADFPKQNGILMLHPKKPQGIFIIYPREGQKTEDILAAIKPALADMFIHDPKTQLQWGETSLPAHKDIPEESGKLLLASDEKMLVQIAAYNRMVEGQEIVYGYFAMRQKSGKDKDPAGEFVDESGGGVKDFDKFWKTIRAEK